MAQRTRRSLPILIACVVTAISLVVQADVRPNVLHEYVAPDTKEDVELATTTPDGQMPAAMVTRSGTVEAPDTTRMPTSTERAYSATAQNLGAERFNPDRDTRRPTVTPHDDPFSPSIAPYKRMRAYDAVEADFTLSLADASLSPVRESGPVSRGEDAFYGDMTVDLVAGEPVRIPTVGPGTRLVRRSTQPRTSVEIVEDGAGNWFAVGAVRTRVRLTLQLAIAQDVFGGAFADTILGSTKRVPKVPENVARSVGEVLRALDLQEERSARAAVTRLVAYFRSFEASDEAPRGRDNVYLDLALSKKGVCRHRAYAFVVTALGMGISSRMVHNEEHAWVEVHDGVSWRRIDLGGASTRVDQGDEVFSRLQHQAAPDPFPWPKNNQNEESGYALSARSAQASQADSFRSTGSMQQMSSLAESQSFSDDATARTLGPTTMKVLFSDARVRRGGPLRIDGSVGTDASPCPLVRVNVLLQDVRSGRTREIGAVSTDESGRFSGSVIVPLEMQVGDYSVVVATQGDQHCGPGTSGP